MASNGCAFQLKRARLFKDLLASDKIEQYFKFLQGDEGSEAKKKLAGKIKESFAQRLVIEDSNIDPYKVFEDIDGFLNVITSGTFRSIEDLKKVQDNQEANEFITNSLMAFSELSAGMINNDDLNYINRSSELLNHYAGVKRFLSYAGSVHKWEKLTENPFVKWLTLSPFTFDRGRVFMSNPAIREAYDRHIKIGSAVNAMTNSALESKENMLRTARSLNLSDEDLGSIVKVMEVLNSTIPNQKLSPEQIDAEIERGLKQRFDDEDFANGIVQKAKSMWSDYRKFNYGKAIGESLFGLPRDYSPLSEKYKDGFLPMMIMVNAMKSNLADAVLATKNINENSEFIKEPLEIARLFKIINTEEGPSISWQWKENYFPHSRAVFSDTELAKNEVYRSLDEANALYASRNKTPEEIDFVNSLNTNIENLRHRNNLSNLRLFTAFLSGYSGYTGDSDIIKGLTLDVTPHMSYKDWRESGIKTGKRNNHNVVKEFIDRMSGLFNKPFDLNEYKKNSLFKKVLIAQVGLMASLPLSTSAVNNMLGAATQMGNEMGIKDSFAVMNNWRKEYQSENIDKSLKDLVIKTQMFEAHGIKLKKFSGIEYGIANTEASGIAKILDGIANIEIKTGQIAAEQGVFSPLAMVLNAVKYSIDAINTRVNYKIPGGEKLSTGIGEIVKRGENNVLSMTGSEDMLLNIEGAVKLQMVQSAVKLKNIARIANNQAPMSDSETMSFANDFVKSTLVKSQVMDKWKKVVGDFSSTSKPFWSWLDLQEASSKMEITKAVVQQMFGMFRHVGLFTTQGSARLLAKSAKTLLKNDLPGRRNLGFAAVQALLAMYELTSKDDGLSVPVVSQMSMFNAPIRATEMVNTLAKIMFGANVKEDEFKSMYFTLGRTMGGVPFGGAIAGVSKEWLGTSDEEFISNILNPSRISSVFEGIADDLADPFYIGKSIMEIVSMNDESIEKLNAYRKEYSSSMIPIYGNFTSMNKPFKIGIEAGRIVGEIVKSSFTDDEDLSNKLLRDSRNNMLTLLASHFGLNSYLNIDTEKANTKFKIRKLRMRSDKNYETGWRNVFN